MSGRIFLFLLVFACFCVGCANISTPTGGKKDSIPPKLLSVTPVDSQLNVRISKLELKFDEYITVSNAQKEIEISPILPVPLTVTGVNKHVTVKLEDSLLEDNTTYRISFGNAVRDLHESNPFVGYTYTFSTGGYFDSLQLKGTVINAATGFPDTSGVIVILHRGSENDSAIVKKKPRYVTRPDNKGVFVFKGLPGRNFRIYAVKDDNSNMTYDGGSELIAFNDSLVFTADTSLQPITLRLFAEIPDTGAVKDSVKPTKKGFKGKDKSIVADSSLIYSVNLDTTNAQHRSFDLTDSIKLVFNRNPFIAKDSIRLTHDSAGVDVNVRIRFSTDSIKPGVLYIVPELAENTVYTLHLDGGFAKDTSGKSAGSGTYKFRTFDDDDYGKIKLSLPGKYLNVTKGDKAAKAAQGVSPEYVLVAMAGDEVVYKRKITDTAIFFKRVRPANYTFRIIVDKNRNGKWDTGDLFDKKQPEEVIPGPPPLVLKAGWEHNLDFEPRPKSSDKKGGSKK